MQNLKSLLLGTIIFFLINTIVAQQLPQAESFNSTNFVWNPAMTGIEDFWQIGTTFKRQWMGFNDAPTNANLNFQYPIEDKNMAVGTYLIHDRVNPLRFNSIGFTYAYQVSFGRKRKDVLSLGLMANLSEISLAGNTVVVNDYSDALLPENGSSQLAPNVGVGVYYQSFKGNPFEKEYFYGGFASNQLLKTQIVFDTDTSDIQLARVFHGNALAGYHFLKGKFSIDPVLWTNFTSSKLTHTLLSVKLEQENTFWTTVSFALDKTIALQIGAILNNKLLKSGVIRVGTQATYNAGKLGQYQDFGYEFFLAYRVFTK